MCGQCGYIIVQQYISKGGGWDVRSRQKQIRTERRERLCTVIKPVGASMREANAYWAIVVEQKEILVLHNTIHKDVKLEGKFGKTMNMRQESQEGWETLHCRCESAICLQLWPLV
uniref:Uncharacterized protein n=1 Tax=Guillardia theta TaxID=55529 RepID=A0A7S4H9F9_GUITH|mmetsp:Transcript_11132/g.37831  ORF Transcript_11132/g.37831 Transcript_11132/m.37831 type:complete len:115 (+) Transcript_11132:180-524(+)